MPPAIYLDVQFCIGKRCVCNVCSSGIWPSELWLYPVFLIVFKAHFIEKLVKPLLAFRRVAVKPGSKPFSVPVPAVTWISKESLFACTYRASCNVRVFHRVVAYHSLTMMFTDLQRHAHSLGVASSPVTVPVVNSLHGLTAFCAVEYGSLNRPRPLALPVLGILIPDFQNLLSRCNLLY